MKKSLVKLALLLFFVWSLIYAIERFDIHIKEFAVPSSDGPDIQERSAGLEGVRNEEFWEKDDFEGTEDDVIGYANQARSAVGLKNFRKNEKLTHSAMLKAQDMKEKGYFEHVSPEGLQPWFFVEQAGYKYKAVGENLAEGYFSAKEVHEAWMGSEGHRSNILSGEFDEIGVAVLEIEKNGRKSFLSVQHFGSELSASEIQLETKTVTICEETIRQDCQLAKEKKDEISDAVKKQEKAIKKAKKQGYTEKDLRDLYDNLEKLDQLKNDAKEYIENCEEYIKGCDEWR